MSRKKFIFLPSGTWKINFSWGSVNGFYGVTALERSAVAFNKSFRVKSGSVKQ
jgi:hypothetical protein